MLLCMFGVERTTTYYSASFPKLVSLFTAAPSLLEECVQFDSPPEQLRALLQHYKCLGQLVTHGRDFCVSGSTFNIGTLWHD